MGRHRRARGRHRAPSTAGRAAARLAVAGAVAAAPLGGTAQATPDWDHVKGPIEQCESGGRNIPTGIPGPFTASGFWQVTDPTWRDHGGAEFAPRAMLATRDEQEIVAERLFNARGTQPWNSSKGCWEPRLGSTSGRHAAPLDAGAVVTPPAASAAAPRHAAPEDVYTVAPGDTLGDIAAAHRTTASALFKANRDTVDDPNRIYPGERLHV